MTCGACSTWLSPDPFPNCSGLEKRTGDRVVSIGEKPYFDKDSKSRREALGLPAFV